MRHRTLWFVGLTFVVCLFLGGPVFAQDKVDLNTANVEELMTLKGVGQARAEAIVKYRKMHGSFQSLDDLKKVPGIGDKTVENNTSRIALGKGMTGHMKSTTMPQKSMTESASENAKRRTTGATEQTKQDVVDKGEKGLTNTKKKASNKTEETMTKTREKTPKSK